MFELLFVLGLLGWLVVASWEWLSALPAFPTLCAVAVLAPLWAAEDFPRVLRRYFLESDRLGGPRMPTPPEQFYWAMHGPRLLRAQAMLTGLALASGAAALAHPARLEWTRSSVLGWLAGMMTVAALGRLGSRVVVYWRAAQWFDPMRPSPAGWYRRGMYWLSENPEFLGRGETREKAIY